MNWHSWGDFTTPHCHGHPKVALRRVRSRVQAGALRRQVCRAGAGSGAERPELSSGLISAAAPAEAGAPPPPLCAPGLRGKAPQRIPPGPARRAAGGRVTYRAGWGRGDDCSDGKFSAPASPARALAGPRPFPAPTPAPHSWRRRRGRSRTFGGGDGRVPPPRAVRRIPARFPPACPATVAGQSHRPPPSQPWGASCPRQSRGHCNGSRSGDGGEGFAVPRRCELLSCPCGRHCPGIADRQPPLAPSTGSRCCRRREGGRWHRGGQTTRWQGIVRTRGWQHQAGVGVRCCRKGRNWGRCFATPCPSRDSSQMGPCYPRQASSGAVALLRACEELRRTVKPRRPLQRSTEQQSPPNLVEWLPEEKEAGCSVSPSLSPREVYHESHH